MAVFFSSSLGIAAIVVVLLVIIYFMSPKPKNVETESENNHGDQVAVSKVATITEEENNKALMKEMELVAAIMGALSSYLGVPASKLKIKSIKRADGNDSTWRRVGLRP